MTASFTSGVPRRVDVDDGISELVELGKSMETLSWGESRTLNL